jgi:hypothetical protein
MPFFTLYKPLPPVCILLVAISRLHHTPCLPCCTLVRRVEAMNQIEEARVQGSGDRER